MQVGHLAFMTCLPAAAEVLSSLSFPPSSRFAIEKAPLVETGRLGTARTDTTTLAAAVAAAAVGAAVAAADGVKDKRQQGGSDEDAARDPNVGFNSRGENGARDTRDIRSKCGDCHRGTASLSPCSSCGQMMMQHPGSA